MRTYRSSRSQSGAALLTAVVFAAVFSTVIGGLAMIAVGHMTLASKAADYSASVQLADAAINFELRNIALKQFLPGGYTAPTAGSPDTGSITGISGTYSAYLTADLAGTQIWTPGKTDVYVWATGTVNGVSRKLVAHGKGGDLATNSTYAVYGLNSVTFSGSGSSVVGSVGTNGTVSSPSSGSSAVTGSISLNGPSAGGVTGSNVATNPDPVYYPTVDQIITTTFSNGWTYLTSNSPMNRANGLVRTFKTGSTVLSAATTQSAGSPWTNSSNVNSMKLRTADFNGLQKNASGNKTIILPSTSSSVPTDYYFTDISLSGATSVVVDNGGLTTGTPGLVRIWMNGSSSGDNLSTPFIYTYIGSNPAQYFRLYYNKAATFQIDGDTASGGLFYGINSTGNANFTITGGSFTYGAVMANNVTISGNSTVQFPSGSVGNSTYDAPFFLWYGIQNGYKEITYGSGATFPDGTSN